MRHDGDAARGRGSRREYPPNSGDCRLLAIGVELTARDVARAGIAALNHKALDDAVEQQRVEVVLLDKLHKIIAVAGRQIAQLERDAAHRGLHLNTSRLAHFGLRATANQYNGGN